MFTKEVLSFLDCGSDRLPWVSVPQAHGCHAHGPTPPQGGCGVRASDIVRSPLQRLHSLDVGKDGSRQAPLRLRCTPGHVQAGSLPPPHGKGVCLHHHQPGRDEEVVGQHAGKRIGMRSLLNRDLTAEHNLYYMYL